MKKILFAFILLGATFFLLGQEAIFSHTPFNRSFVQMSHPIAKTMTGVENHLVLAKAKMGFPIMVDERDGIVARYIINSGVWEQHVTEVLQRLVHKGDKVIEVGGNYGYHTILLSKLVGQNGKVYTYEANDEVCNILNKNIRLNQLHNTEMKCVAVSNKIGTATFFTGYSNLGGSFVIGKNADLKHLKESSSFKDWHEKTVNTIYLDKDLNNIKGIHLLRMDAEGSELVIIEGAKKILKASPNIKIVMEWDVEMLSNFGNVATFLSELAADNFKFYVIDENARLIRKNTEEMLKLSHCDIVMARENLDNHEI